MNVNSRSESSVAATAAAVPAGRVTENEAIDRRFKELDERLERIEKSQKKSAKEVKDLTDRVQKLVSLSLTLYSSCRLSVYLSKFHMSQPIIFK